MTGDGSQRGRAGNCRDLINVLAFEALLFHSPVHGIAHWRRVERNGLYLSAFTGADRQVVSYFAYLHDSMRCDEWEDAGHGVRAAEFAVDNRDLFDLDDDQFHLLGLACRAHTGGKRAVNTTIATCWDADRLDLGRVGIKPDARHLFSDEARRIANETDFSVLGKQ